MNRTETLSGIINSVKAMAPDGRDFPLTGQWNLARKSLKDSYQSGTDAEFLEACNAYVSLAKSAFNIRPTAPCLVCGSPTFWLSTYAGSPYRCLACHKPPAKNLIREILNLGDDPTLGAEPSHDLARVLPDWHFPPWPNDWSRISIDRGRSARPDTDHLAEPTCSRCGSREFLDTQIHDGKSTRRDCTRCRLTKGFPKWAGSDANLTPPGRESPRQNAGAARGDEKHTLVDTLLESSRDDPLAGLF